MMTLGEYLSQRSYLVIKREYRGNEFITDIL